MQMPQQNNILLELHVPDFQPIREYYEKLGFTVKWLREPEGFKGYMIIAMDQNILCFWAGNEHVHEQEYFSQFPKDSPRGYGVEIVIMVDEVKAYYDQVKEFANVVEPLVLRPWGLEDFRTADPAGFYLRFTTKHDIFDNQFTVE